eukprot:scpid95662/ scgid28552/ Vesicle-fusing ATPase; N-ethylmaleimide-sensitive fusion protein; Suppressor of K(+) transport growth defect 2; Vesicular-fusion protein NSF
MARQFRVEKAPSDALSLTNRAIFHPKDVKERDQYFLVTSSAGDFVLTPQTSSDVSPGCVALGLYQRKWVSAAQGDTVTVRSYQFTDATCYLEVLTVRVDHVARTAQRSGKQLNSDRMTAEVSSTYASVAVSVGQQLLYRAQDHPRPLYLTVLSLQAADPSVLTKTKASPSKRSDISCGIILPDTNILFEGGEGVTVTGKHIAGAAVQGSVISTSLDFVKMGIG